MEQQSYDGIYVIWISRIGSIGLKSSVLMEHKWSERQLITNTVWKIEQGETSQTMQINQSSEED